jgi:hypothetical protein
MRGDDITAGGGCGTHCAVRQGSSSSAGNATGKFWGSREQPEATTIHVGAATKLLWKHNRRTLLAAAVTGDRDGGGGTMDAASGLHGPAVRGAVSVTVVWSGLVVI